MSESRLAAFVRSEYQRLVAYGRKLGDDLASEDGEDVVQDVLLGILDRPDPGVPIENLAAYVYRSIRNKVVDRFRRFRPETLPVDGSGVEESLSVMVADLAQDTEGSAERSELIVHLIEIMEGMPSDQSSVVIETEFNGRTFREISQETGEPMGTLLARKKRAMDKIRNALERLK